MIPLAAGVLQRYTVYPSYRSHGWSLQWGVAVAVMVLPLQCRRHRHHLSAAIRRSARLLQEPEQHVVSEYVVLGHSEVTFRQEKNTSVIDWRYQRWLPFLAFAFIE